MYRNIRNPGIRYLKWGAALFAYLFIFLLNAEAAPALDKPFMITQPDGTVILAKNKGDEWLNWTENAAGFPIAQASDNYWYIVQSFVGNTPVLSGIRADAPFVSSVMKKARPTLPSVRSMPLRPPSAAGQAVAKAGPFGRFADRVLFILVEFRNQRHKTPPQAWARKLKEIRKYYRTVSYRNVSLAPARETFGRRNDGIVGWLKLPMNHPNTRNNTGLKNQLLAKKAILAANRYVNFAAYDKNKDGYVDSNELAIVVIAAGYEAAYANIPRSVWGHAWAINRAPKVDGVTVGAYWNGLLGYAQFGELHGTKRSNHQATLGIMVHELGHLIFAWPDLYDYDNSSSGIGAFGLMSAGNWGMTSRDKWAGQTPVSPTGWSKLQRGWVKPAAATKGRKRLVAAGARTANKFNTVLKLGVSASGKEYFVVENRQDQGYDRGFERWFGPRFKGGLVIYHVDDNMTVNTNDRHRWVDVEEADGTPMGKTQGALTDMWSTMPGSATTFNAKTIPNSNYYNGSPSGVSISNISAPKTNMTLMLN